MFFCTALIPRATQAAGLRTWVALLWLCLANPLLAADLAGEFLEGLRARGWHDVALDYLATADEDPLATTEFLDRLDYERAVTLAAIARESIRESKRLDLSGQAIALFQRYAASHRNEPLYFEAMSSAGSLLSEQALSKLAKANRLPAGASRERESLRTEARAGFDSAARVVEQLLDACEKKLASLPKGAMARQDPDTPVTRQQLTVKQAETRFLGANLLFEKANTYDAPSRQFNETLDAAAEAFSQLHKDYSDKLVGFYGRLYEGRCYQMAGKLSAALTCYADLVDQPFSNPDFRRLVARAYRRRAECHLAADNLDDAIRECRDWLNDARGAELKQPEWLAVAYRLAEVCQQKAALAGASEAPRLRAEARRLLREVSREPGEFQVDARTVLASGNVLASTPSDVKTFGKAFTVGKEALERMNSSKLAARLAVENNPDAVADLKQQADHNQAEARRLFQIALSLADDDSKLDDVLAVRYYLCWIYWEDELLYEAAVMGQFLARSYPESSYAMGAAKVALAAHEKLYYEAKQAGEDSSYEAAQLSSLAELVARLWPESSEAGAAVNLLIQIALGDDRLEEAEQLLQQLPESSRAAAELNLGSALWTRYLHLTAKNTDEIGPTTAQLKERAEQLLSSGYDALSTTAAPSAQAATGVLYYVQLLLAEGEFDRAVAVLENRSVGPLAVVENGRVQAAFAYEAYKAALRAYISIVPPQRDKAQDMMTALEEAIGPEDDAQQLTRIYLSLGLQLQRQISELSSSGQTAQAQDVAAAFEDLLQRITRRGSERDWRIRNWIAQTNLRLGEELRGEAAQHYLEQAEQVYREILADVEQDSDYAPSEIVVLGVRKQLGDCLRAQQKFDQAFDEYVSILSEKPNMLDLQRTAALMLQQWGQDQQQSSKLEEAIRGTRPQANRKNLVWGWLRLANIADQAKQKAASGSGEKEPDEQKIQKYHNLYFEARYHVAKTRLLAAQLASGAKRTKQLNSARKNVESMKRLYPDLGGLKWQQAFDELLKQIEAESST
ncbi:MAG: hypothetical protein IH898_01640 [Planctomycetes bacterium]|nr:hypothetical protein [Planctomycetota bacterium]